MARRVADASRVILDIVGDVRAALGDDNPEDAGTNRHTPEPITELRVGRSKSLHRDDVHVDTPLVTDVSDNPLHRLSAQC